MEFLWAHSQLPSAYTCFIFFYHASSRYESFVTFPYFLSFFYEKFPYRKVMSQKKIHQYKNKVELNEESYQILKYLVKPQEYKVLDPGVIDT